MNWPDQADSSREAHSQRLWNPEQPEVPVWGSYDTPWFLRSDKICGYIKSLVAAFSRDNLDRGNTIYRSNESYLSSFKRRCFSLVDIVRLYSILFQFLIFYRHKIFKWKLSFLIWGGDKKKNSNTTLLHCYTKCNINLYRTPNIQHQQKENKVNPTIQQINFTDT